MQYFNNPGNYPLDCIPEELRQAILAIHAKVKAPIEIVAASVLSVASIGAQHLARVKRPTGQISPMGLSLLTLAASGERKTSADDVALVPIRAFEARMAEQYKRSMADYETEIIAWRAHRSGFLQQIKKNAANGTSDHDLVSQLRALQDTKPIHPRLTRILYSDTTPQALALGLYKNSGSAALQSNEASKLLFGAAMDNLAQYSELWSSGSTTVDRVTFESFALHDVALTISLMVQPSEMDRYLSRKGSHMRGSGFLARCLASRPISIQGFREILSGEFHETGAIDRFHERITELLGTNNAQPTDHVICFDDRAAVIWANFFNEVERLQQPWGLYSDITDFASKIADNAARIAAIFCCYDRQSDAIGAEHIQHAAAICRWYLAQFKMIFGSASQISVEQQDATLLEQWLMSFRPHNDGFIYVEKSFIQQRGPNRLRSRGRLHSALQCLGLSGRLSEFLDGKKRVIQFVPTPPLPIPIPSVAPLTWRYPQR